MCNAYTLFDIYASIDNVYTDKSIGACIVVYMRVVFQGKISDVDIQRIAKELGENFTMQEIREMIEEADRNGEQFLRFFYQYNFLHALKLMHFLYYYFLELC